VQQARPRPIKDPRLRHFIRVLNMGQYGPPRLSFHRMIRSEPFRELCGYYRQPLDQRSLVRFRHAAEMLERTFE
jgi:hypothetical protein